MVKFVTECPQAFSHSLDGKFQKADSKAIIGGGIKDNYKQAGANPADSYSKRGTINPANCKENAPNRIWLGTV